jgi:tetratricopeptide (TPR) repeat protein
LEIKKDCAAFRLHFAPESLRHFELVHQNSSYRLYRVLEPGKAPVLGDFPESPVYDLAQYGGQSIDGRAFDDQWSMKMVERIRQSFQLIDRGQERLASHPAAARDLLERARKQYPNLIGQATVLGTALVLTGDLQAGLALLRQEVRDHPYFALARYNLAYALYCSDDYQAARAELDQCLQLDPDFEPAREMIKEIDAPN